MNRHTKTPILFFIAMFFVMAWMTPAYAAAQWTFMIYLDGDNNLESSAINDFLEMAEVGSNANINIVLQMDRIDGYDEQYGDWKTCKRFHVTRNMTPTSANALQDMGEANMGDPDTLKAFINWTVSSYPADRYALILWDHGDGWTKKRKRRKDTPIYKGVCWDDTNNGNGLTMAEIRDVLNSVSTKPDMIGFDACLNGMIENAYLLKDLGPEVMVGSEENEPGDGWPYDTILKGLDSDPSWTPAQLGSWIVDKYYESYWNNQTQSATDLSKVSALATAVSDFATTMRISWNSEKEAVKTAAQLVMSRLEDAVINTKNGNEWRGAEGLSIYFPTESYYVNSAYGQTDFAQNTNWDEFLDEYHDSMRGSWIEDARKQAVYFGGEDHERYYPHIDLHHFCSLLADAGDISPGYSIQESTYDFEDISETGNHIQIDDDNYARISPSGFAFTYYDNSHTAFSISDNGVIYFQDYKFSVSENEQVPGCRQMGEAFLAPYWDDFGGASAYWQVAGSGSDKRLIVQWDGLVPYGGNVSSGGTFQAILYESGRILCQYEDTDFGDTAWNHGNSATVGLQGTVSRGIQYSYNSQKVGNHTALLFIPETQGTCTYALSSKEKRFDSAGGDSNISVTADGGCGWTASSNAAWISITDGKTGTGSGAVKYSVTQNTGLSPRTGTMSIAEQTFTVIQSAPCAFEISPSEKTFSASAGTGMISVTASASGCTWESLSHPSWISITSGSSGTGNGTVWYSVQQNSGSERTGTLTVAGNTFAVSQDTSETPEAVMLSNGVALKNISQDLGGSLYYKIRVPSGASNLQILTQGGTGDCDLYARYGQMPITESFDETSASYANDENIVISAPRTGDWYVMLYAYQRFSGVSLTASYNTQSCTYTLSPQSLAFSASGGSGNLDVSAGSDCSWIASTSASWIEIIGSASGTGNGKVNFQVLKNTDTDSRSGTISLMDETFTVSQEGAGSVEILTLTNNVAQTGLSGVSESIAYYKIAVPSAQNELRIETWGGQGDCDVFVRYGEIPSSENYGTDSSLYGNDELINIEAPQAGDWYIMLYGYEAYSDASLKAAYAETVCAYTLSQTEISLGSSGGGGSISVTADSGCSWNALSHNEWIVATSGSSGTGTGTVAYSVSANEDLEERSGTLEIAGHLVFIVQQGTASVISLSNGVEENGLSGVLGDNLFFKIEVPEGHKNLVVDSWGGTGDMDMYVRYGAPPAADAYDFQCFAWGNDENVHVRNPDPGAWYVLLHAYANSSDVSIKAEYDTLDCEYIPDPVSESFDASGGYGTLSVSVGDGCSWTAIKHGTWIEIDPERRGTGNGSVTYQVLPNEDAGIRTNNIRIADQWITVTQAGTDQTTPDTLTNGVAQNVSGTLGTAYYQIDVPEGQESLTIETSGGTGDCDLYVRYGEIPTYRIYDFRPYFDGNDETVTVENPQPGTWYVMLGSDPAYSDVSLKAEYQTSLCTYALSETEISAGRSGKTGNITVSTGSDCSWTVSGDEEWIAVTSEGTGTGAGTVAYSILENSGLNERIGSLDIAGVPVTIRQQGAAAITSLSNDVAISDLSGEWGDSLFFSIEVPAGQKNLMIESWGGTGDADMYVSHNVLPTNTVFDSWCFAWGNSEYVYVKDPEPGQWYILLHAYDIFSGASLKAKYDTRDCNYTLEPMSVSFDASGGSGTLSVSAGSSCSWTAVGHGSWIGLMSSDVKGTGNGSVRYQVSPNKNPDIRANNIRIADQWVTIIQAGTVQTTPELLEIDAAKSVSDTSGEGTYFQIDIPSGQGKLLIETAGGTGDCDLYVRYGELPTYRLYDFRPYFMGNDESVSVTTPQAGTWYVMLKGTYSDVSLKAQVEEKSARQLAFEDGIAMLQILTGITSDLPKPLAELDFDNNGKIGMEDAVYALQFASGQGNGTRHRSVNPARTVRHPASEWEK